MQKFSYNGILNDQKVDGEIESESKLTAFLNLKKKGIVVWSVTPLYSGIKKVKKKKVTSNFFKEKIKPQDIVSFTKQFATMVKAGLPILGTLEMVRDQTVNLSMKEIIENIRKKLPNNITLSLIDDFNINGDFIESQAFAYLAIRSLLKNQFHLPIQQM